jgi:2-iminobutanoate/2-iminopropanoate deaminase
VALRKDVVSGPGVPPTIGPYSAGVRAGDLLFVSGQAGLDPATGSLSGPTFGEQSKQAMRNVEAVLVAGGSRLDLVVNTTVLLADFADFAELNEVFSAAFPADPPARMTMQTPLPGGVLVSVGCVAVVAP